MKLEKLHIKNFKSLVDLEIIKPNPFTVFAGPNGAGKSNIFEALEFGAGKVTFEGGYHKIFGSKEDIISRLNSSDIIEFSFTIEPVGTWIRTYNFSDSSFGMKLGDDHDFKNFTHNGIDNFWLSRYSRIFIGNRKELKLLLRDDSNLVLDGSNLERVLKRLLTDKLKREGITEYLELFIPGFNNIAIHSDNIGGSETILIYEKGIDKPFTKNLISDGTYNILCLLTALFQSEEPQFLCIEEPENGLNPYVVQEFVELCRLMCEDHGHYIWLNTHSQTLVRALKEEELILVDKENGATTIKQFEAGAFHGLKADEAWLTNSLGAGIPW